MSNIDLLDTVLATEGYYCIAGLKNGFIDQTFHSTREEVDTRVQELLASDSDVYFALARFETTESRTKENVKLLRAFWLDIDCGPLKAEVDPKTGIPDGYIDQTAAINDLGRFCNLTGLPMPILVNSGRGIHAYWPLTRDVTRAEWEPIGRRLAQLCVTHKLYADPSVFEVSRILRVPGTFNFKDDPPSPVEVLSNMKPMPYEDFKTILGVSDADLIEKPKREYTALGKKLMENIESSFSRIMRRSLEGNGCKQLADCFLNKDTLSEPRWFNALSVAKFCRDADKAIHKMSEGHPDYDPSATEGKIQHIKGPHTCVQFEKHNPGGCEGCPFKGKITSPITLGREVIEAANNGEEYLVTAKAEFEDKLFTYHVPKYPAPFVRGKSGGIYYVPKEEEAEPITVYDHDLYITSRLKDPDEGEVFLIKHHLPLDDVESFTIKCSEVADKAALRNQISNRGVMCSGKQWDYMLNYLTLMGKELQYKQRLYLMRTQFGWADGNSKFILGEREITKDGIFYSPSSKATSDFSPKLTKKGSLDKWKEVFALYGTPGHEPHAFAALSAFGAPLLKFTGQMGIIINLIHPRSGTGKTTILRMINSVYGMPQDLCAVQKDTTNAKIHHLGVMNNLPFTIDEITNTTPMEFSDLVYSMTQGRGKNRMDSQTNSLRTNNTTWGTISTASSNASFYEKLQLIKAAPEGEMMRLIEYKIDYTSNIDRAHAKQMFDHQLMENYGHAGEIYLQYLVNNQEAVKELLAEIQTKVDTELKLEQRERCWSAAIAANMAGLRIAERLGLIKWDQKAIYLWIAKVIADMRDQVVPPLTNSMAILADFIHTHTNNILIINDKVDLRTKLKPTPIMVPRSDLLIRIEPDTKRMYIQGTVFREFCINAQINHRDTIKELEDKKIIIETKNKRLSKGYPIESPTTRLHVLDTSHPEFMDLESVMPENDAD